jgi:GH35 family endo-1,4-beta-xylanase
MTTAVFSMTDPTRRRFLKYAGAAAAGVALGAVAGRYTWIPTPSSHETVTETATRTETVTKTIAETVTETFVRPWSLRAAAEAKGLLIGSSVEGVTHTSWENPLIRIWEEDPNYASVLSREFDYLTPACIMKWETIDKWGFAPADALVKFASDYQMKVKGHCLVWHLELPAWVNSSLSADALRQAMEKHIREEVGHYRSKVYAWDVVNEAVDDAGKLRKTIFLDKLGEGYIAEAFQLAHEADPDALLFYNDYAEWPGAKSDRVYKLVKKLVADGVPIHGVGLQMHLDAWDCPDPEDIAANVRRLAALGLKVNISEMDVRITEKKLRGTLQERLEIQRRIYHDVIAACIREKGFMGITFWGFTDAHSWIDLTYGPDDPLLFDENYQPKPAYWGVMGALLGI